MARPPLYDDALRRRLLDVTVEIVDRDGPARVSLRDVAQRAETSTSAVYSLFGGKGELLTAVIEEGFASFSRAQSDAEPEGLRALGIAYRRWALANPALYRLMFGGAQLVHDMHSSGTAMAPSALLPLARTLAATASIDHEGLRNAITVWAQVHGAVSLELAGVVPVQIDADAVYETVLDTIERAFPPR